MTADSSEADVDAYLSNPAFYPVGTFDETQDGVGNPVMNTPLFRQDLAAPFGSAGEFAELLDISNGSFTTNLDPTTLVTPEGRAFLKARAGALGEELANCRICGRTTSPRSSRRGCRRSARSRTPPATTTTR